MKTFLSILFAPSALYSIWISFYIAHRLQMHIKVNEWWHMPLMFTLTVFWMATVFLSVNIIGFLFKKFTNR